MSDTPDESHEDHKWAAWGSYDAEAVWKKVYEGLKDFQKATVDHVVDCFVNKGQKRVLVADEVGLGKTIIARGVIAGIAKSRHEERDDLFNVVYVCSNQSIASQNISKLTIDGAEKGR